MKQNFSISAALTAVCLLACASTTHAHTWVESLRVIASNGTFVGAEGFPRGFVPRIPGPADAAMVYLLPSGSNTAFLPTDLMCKSSQMMGNQTSGYPPLQAAPGDQVALRYEENGHVTLFTVQQGKPAGRGTVFVYGTNKPSNDDAFLEIHRVWNTAGTGGNKNGKLLATQPYDDGRCFQVNSTPLSQTRGKQYGYVAAGGTRDTLCQTDITIPTDAGTSGTYTLYWVWEWPSLYTNGNVRINETYTTCMDIDLVSKKFPDSGPFNSAQITGLAENSVGIEARMTAQILVDPLAPPYTTSDDPGAVQTGIAGTNTYSAATFVPFAPNAAAVTSLAPVTTTKSTASPAATSNATTTPPSISIVSTSHASYSPVASSQAPQGFVTVTVTATEKIMSTTTVYAPSSSTTYFTTTVFATGVTTMTINSPSPASHSMISTVESEGGIFATVPSSSSTLSSYFNVSAPSGKYSTNTVVPTVVPFMTGGATARRARPRLVT